MGEWLRIISIRDHHVSPVGVRLLAGMGPACLLALYSFLTKTNDDPFSQYHFVFFLGLCGIAIPNTNMYFCLHLPVGLMAIIDNMAPIFIYIIAITLGDESFSLNRLCCVFSAVVGVLLIVQRGIARWGSIHCGGCCRHSYRSVFWFCCCVHS